MEEFSSIMVNTDLAKIEADESKAIAWLSSALTYLDKVENAKADRLANHAKVSAWLAKIELRSDTELVTVKTDTEKLN